MVRSKAKRGRPGLKGRLLEKSIEAYILALETINRLSAKYRVETFAYLICNAWELLLKAKLLSDTGTKKSIYYKKQRGSPRRSLSLRDCLKRILPNENDSTRRNLEYVADLRDESVHLVISQVPRDVMALFLACVLNYHKRLVEWFGISLSDRVPVGMMTLVYDLSPEQFDLEDPVLRRSLGRDAVNYLSKFQAELNEEFAQLGKPSEFSIPVDYGLVLDKKVGKADIVLTAGTTGTMTRVVEVPKDPGKTHPFRQTELVDAVNAALGGAAVINRYDIQCIVKAFDVKKRSTFFHKTSVKGSPSQYSQEFADWLVAEYEKDNQLFAKARVKAKKP